MENYIVSARKYRPITFESVVGQQSLTETLRNAIRQNHLAHAYLFCGPRGVGKTTCARIFAKTINCLHPTDGHDACNECESCQAFNEQRSFNIHELDAASNNGVEDIRALIEQTRIPPQIGKYSVYIIDEVHMLSQGAFNALLKTLEEPPAYVIFILATTEKHKVLPTILSRCQVYDFSRITVADIIHHLQFVAKQEGVEAEEEALNIVAQKADGGLRDALSIFDQLVAFCGEKITYDRTIEVLNVLDTDYYFRLVEMAIQGKVNEAMLLLNEVLLKGFDAGHLVTGLAQHLRDVLMSKDASTLSLLETSEAIRKRYQEQAAQCAAPWIFAALDILNTCDVQYRLAKNQRLTVELALIKLCRLNAPKESIPTVTQPVVPVTPKAAPTTPTAPKVAPIEPVAPKVAPTIPTMPNLPSLHPERKVEPSASPQEDHPIVQQDVPFTNDRFLDAWAGLKKMFKDEARLMAVLDEYQPKLVDSALCVLTLANPWQCDEFKKYVNQIQNHLRSVLHNNSLQLSLEVAAYDHSQVAYTADEKYKLLAEKNPALKNLKEQLNLQLE